MNDGLQGFTEDLVGSNPKWKYSIKDANTLSGIDLDELQDRFENRSKYFESNPCKITKGYEVKLNLTISGDEYDWKSNSVFVLLKIDGEWLIYKWYYTTLGDKRDTIFYNEYLDGWTTYHEEMRS